MDFVRRLDCYEIKLLWNNWLELCNILTEQWYMCMHIYRYTNLSSSYTVRSIWTLLSAVPRKAVRFNHSLIYCLYHTVNSLRPMQDGRHFADDIFKCIFINENVWVFIIISLKFIPKGPMNDVPALVQTMAWCRPGDKLLSESMMFRLSTHICVPWPQWVNPSTPGEIFPGMHELDHCWLSL